MAKLLQLRRGTTAEHSTFTGAVGEVTIDTDKDVIVVHDGVTAGGVPMLKASDIITSLVALTDTTITSPSDGQVLSYDNATSKWVNTEISGGATGGGTDRIFVENDQIVTTNYTLVGTKNASTAGPITINTGVTVTVETGARWVII